MARIRDVAVFCLVVFSVAARVSGQTTEVSDPAEAARFRFGPLRFTPSIAITNLGLDSNVFNDPNHPSQDTVGAAGPAANYWMHVGPSLITGKTAAQYLYFDKYESERALNTDNQLRWEVPFARLIPFAEGKYVNAKNRAGFEVDTRTRVKDQDVTLGTDVLVSAKTRLTLAGTRSHVKYDDNATFLGVNLGQALDRWTNTETLQLHYKLTSQTTFEVRGDATQDRFASDPLRNTNSIAVLPGFVMRPTALVSGTVFVGFRDFEPLDPTVPRYRGPVAAVDARYILGATRVALRVDRDIEYSFQAYQPHYTLMDIGLDVTQRITYTWDVLARAGRGTLDYATRNVPGAPTVPQADRVEQCGVGVGYRVGPALRLGVNGDYMQRRSTNPLLRDYQAFRVGASITYGLPQ